MCPENPPELPRNREPQLTRFVHRRPRRTHAEVLAEIDGAAAAEGPDQLTRLCTDRVDPVPHKVEDPLPFGALPVCNPAIAQPDDRAVVVHSRVERPDTGAGGRID